MDELSISVSLADIDAGVPKDGYACPIAIALSCQLDCAYKVLVCQDFIRLEPAGRGFTEQAYFYATPAWLRDWITDFDEGRPVAPFRVTLARSNPYDL